MKTFYYSFLNLLRGRGSNVTRVISLSLGLTIGILLFSRIAFEFSYEKCYPESERLAMVRYKMMNTTTGEITGDEGNTGYDYTVFDQVAATLAQDMPKEIESASCVFPFQEYRIYYDDKLLSDVRYITVDTCFFQTLGIPVLKGNPKDLAMPRSVFVSEHFARETFGDSDPIGKIFLADKQRELTIRGVYKDMPENSMLIHDFVVSVHMDGGYENGAGWKGNDIFYAFLRLRNASNLDKVNQDIQRVISKYSSMKIDDWEINFSVIPLRHLHLDSPDTQRRLIIYAFLAFAIFFVSIMNYMLISIAALSRRAKSVGVHKCSGASSMNIFSMFLIETGILILVSVLISVLLIINSSDLIEELLAVNVASLFIWETLWVPLLTIVLLFVMAGGIPGRLFSRIPVTQVFRRYTDGKKGWKRSLLFVQFTGVSFVIGLLLVTILQYNHLMSRDMGIDIPGLAEAECMMKPDSNGNIKDELRRQPMVEGITVSTHSVFGQYWTRGLMGNDGKRIATLNYNNCHFDYPEVMGIRIIEGTTLKKENDLLVNEEVVRLMRWTDGAVGKTLNGVEGTIVGVFKDVRNESFYSEQSPIVLIGSERYIRTFNVRLKEPYDENLKRLNEYIQATYPSLALNFQTVDSMIKRGYQDVYRFRNSVWITSGFILIIVIMGLIGYVNDETQRRSKEIAIRKVNGADAAGILKLLARDILGISVVSILIGTVVSYFVGKNWLEQFAEGIDMNPLLFIGAALFIQFLILACVILKAWRIANENPINSIKSE